MYAMQYQLARPADYDLGIIRSRVATRGSALDSLEGLGAKAYLVRDRANGCPVNQYAPFYLWTDPAAMGRFLWGGGGFGGIVADFGRPAVRHYIGAAFRPGPAFASRPDTAHFDTVALPLDANPADVVGAALEELDDRLRDPRVHSIAMVVDPDRWLLGHLTLGYRPAEPPPADGYEVLHFSHPHLDDLTS